LRVPPECFLPWTASGGFPFFRKQAETVFLVLFFVFFLSFAIRHLKNAEKRVFSSNG